MKTKLAFLAVSIALCGTAHATSNDNNSDDIVKELYDLRAGLHDVHMNTLQKYSESWGLEDRANIAKLQETKLDKSVFAVDQARQDKALTDSIAKQAATDSKQTSDLKGYADKKADSAYSTSVAHTDSKVARADSDRAKGDAALQTQITSNLASQSDRDAGQDDHINAVQGAAQSANEKADAGAVRADGIEQRAAVTDNRSINNAVRLDGAEQGIRDTNAQADIDRTAQVDGDRMLGGRIDKESDTRARQVVQLAAGIDNAQATGDYAAARADQAFSNASANSQAIRKTNAVVAEHSATLANHEQRLSGLEQETQRGFSSLHRELGKVRKTANAGTSAALSSAAIPQVTEYQTFAVGAGLGGYEGEQALAVGVSARVASNVVVKASVTRDSNQGTGWNVGTSIGW